MREKSSKKSITNKGNNANLCHGPEVNKNQGQDSLHMAGLRSTLSKEEKLPDASKPQDQSI